VSLGSTMPVELSEAASRDPRRSLIIGGAVALAVLVTLAVLLMAGAAIVVAGRPG